MGSTDDSSGGQFNFSFVFFLKLHYKDVLCLFGLLFLFQQGQG